MFDSEGAAKCVVEPKLPLISVIIPVYNTAAYLGRCLESVLKSSYENIEVICINDGSRDNSLEILQGYAAKDSRVYVFSKENGGLSSARNAGLNLAKGEYISFVDSDDYISEDFLKYLFDGLNTSQADIAACRFKTVHEESQTHNDIQDASGHVFDLEAAVKDFAVRSYVCNKLYRKHTLEGFQFSEAMRYAEDACFNLAVMCQSIGTTVWVTEAQLYYYYMRSTSIIHTTSHSALLKTVPYYMDLADRATDDRIKWIFCYQAFKNTWNGRYFSMYLPDKKQKYTFAKQCLAKCLKMMYALPQISPTQKLLCISFSKFPFLYRLFRIYDDKTMLMWERAEKEKYKAGSTQ